MDTHGDEYTTLRTSARASLTVRGSKFLAQASPAPGKSACEEILRGAKKEYHDATHNCFAYRLGADGAQSRTGDDGEPSGTAGRPILAAIDAAGLTGVIVVVTRYFGGVKLGTAGLARAYRLAAERALAEGEPLKRYLCDVIGISFPHACVGPVMRALGAAGGRVASSQYGGEVAMEVEIRRSRAEGLRGALQEATSGAVRFTGR